MDTDTTSIRTSARLRRLSKDAFNSAYRVEVALAALEMPQDTFTFDELYEKVRLVATTSGVDEIPSASKTRSEVQCLRDVYAALARLPRVKGESVKREVRRPSALWALCRELYERASEG